ncbi:histone deacetylase [Streptomyces sp. NPDC008079]|uniref:histone deacetylase n=1 Tax=Streptomyces sp. NPDC008079 TaxID=3364806 RepID=UPI0036E19BF9
MPATSERLVWYVSYGSNMSLARLRCYLTGGTAQDTADGGGRTYPGCRDPRMPERSVGIELPGTVYFATWSPVWHGGRAFYDPLAPGRAWARAHLLTLGQFSDIAAQEMYAAPGHDLDLTRVLAEGRDRLGPGRYETLLHLGDLETHPLLTFTAPWHAPDARPVAPSPAYLAHLAAGLREAHTWPPEAITTYLAGLTSRSTAR